MSGSARVVCAGEVMVELAPQPGAPDLLQRGCAGDTFNTAVHLARENPALDVSYLTRLGDDPLSDEIVARLEHPAIVPVYDSGRTEDGRPYFTMRIVRGRSMQVAVDAGTGDDSVAGGDGDLGGVRVEALARFDSRCAIAGLLKGLHRAANAGSDFKNRGIGRKEPFQTCD